MDLYSSHLKPMTISNILDYTFKVYRRHFVTIFLFSLIVAGVFNVFTGVVLEGISPVEVLTNPFEQIMELFSDGADIHDDALSGIDIYDPDMMLDFGFEWMLFFGASLMMTGVQMLFIYPFVNGGIAGVTSRFLHEKDADLEWAFKAAWGKFGKLVVTSLCLAVYMMAAYIGLVLLMIIPIALIVGITQAAGAAGIILAVLMIIVMVIVVFFAIAIVYSFISMIYPIVMIEGEFHFKAIGRSFTLVRRKFWKTIGIVILVYLLSSIVSSSINSGISMVFLFINAPGVLLYTFQAIVSAIVSPIIYIAVTLLYFDIIISTEGYDIQYRETLAGGTEI